MSGSSEPKVDLAELRRSRNWSQAQLASALGVAQSTVSRIEKGEIAPRGAIVKLAERIAAETDV